MASGCLLQHPLEAALHASCQNPLGSSRQAATDAGNADPVFSSSIYAPRDPRALLARKESGKASIGASYLTG